MIMTPFVLNIIDYLNNSNDKLIESIKMSNDYFIFKMKSLRRSNKDVLTIP